MRLAWFSPMPPAATGIATCSAEVVAALRARHAIDVFVDEPLVRTASLVRSAHDFVWRHQQQPYDLIVYQLGNSSHHDYEWPYIFRYPGLIVLHDAHLHHARAACLLRASRGDAYREEFARNHPEANLDLAELAIAGFDNQLHYAWPMTRLAIESSRLVAVHRAEIAGELAAEVPDARIEVIHLGHGVRLAPEDEAALKRRARDRYGIAQDAIVFGCYGGLTPDKRVPQVLAAFAATRPAVPAAHLLLAGAAAAHYDVRGEIARLGLEDCTTLTGYLPAADDFTACVAACDIALNLRWPTAREVSGPWLHCLAAGKPTVIVDLAHLWMVPALDPRSWRSYTAASLAPRVEPCAVAIDILDEDHSLRLAMHRLATDADLRMRLGSAARTYWAAHHSLDLMVADYERLIADASARPAPKAELPPHLLDTGSETLHRELARFGLPSPLEHHHPWGRL